MRTVSNRMPGAGVNVSRDVMQFRTLVDAASANAAPAQRALDGDLKDPLAQPIQVPMQRKLEPVQRSGGDEEEAQVQAKKDVGKLELGGGGGPAPDDGDDGATPIQPKGAPAGAPPAPPSGGAKGGGGSGSPLPKDVRAKMEASFGTSFENVRVREDGSAKELNALAYTRGNLITFAPGKMDFSSQSGLELLGHEITHTRQQQEGRVKATRQAKGVGINDDSGLESEADRMGAKAARGEPVDGAAAKAAPAPPADAPAQRKASEEEEEAVQAKAAAPVQRSAGEEEEEEIQAKAAGPVQRSAGEEEEEEIQAKAAGPVQRSAGEEEEEEVQAKAAGPVQRKEDPPTKDLSKAPKVDFSESAKEDGEAWEPVRSDYKSLVFEGQAFTAIDAATSAPLQLFLTLDLGVANYRKVDGPQTEASYSRVPAGMPDLIAKKLERALITEFSKLVATDGYTKTVTGGLQKVSDPIVAKLNEEMRGQRVWIASALVHLAQEAQRESLRKQREDMQEYLDGKKDAPGEKAKEEAHPEPEKKKKEKAQEDEKEKDKEKATEQDAKPAEEPKAEAAKKPDAGTPIRFVTPKFLVKDPKSANRSDRNKGFPVVVSGQAWVKPKSDAKAQGVPAEASVKARRAVATSFPMVFSNLVQSKGFEVASSERELAQICKVVAITAGYDAERFDLSVVELQAQVVRDQAAEKAFAEAESEGVIDAKEEVKPSGGVSTTKDEATGSFAIPMLQLGGGIIARDLAGSATFDKKTKELKRFQGAAMVIVPIGDAQVLEVSVGDAVIVRKGATYQVERGKGTFTAKMPIHLFDQGGWSWFVAENATGSVTVAKDDIEDISGAITLRARNTEGKDVFEIVSNFSFAIDKTGKAKKPLDGSAAVTLLEDVGLGEGFGPNATWSAFLSKGSTGTAKVAKGSLTGIDGALKAHLVEAGKTWLTMSAKGAYDNAARKATLNSASIDVLVDTVVGRAGEGRDVVLNKKGGVTASLADNVLTEASGDLAVTIREGGKDKLRGSVNGKWSPADGLDGKGNLTLLDDYHAEVPGGFLKLYKGSNGNAELLKGALQSLGGEVEADFTSLFRGEPLELNFKGKAHYDWTKKTLVSATGTGKLTKALMLSERLRVDKLTGSVWLANNDLIKAQGELESSFLNEQGVLFEGKVNGNWSAEGAGVNGKGTVTLKQDLETELGASLSGRVQKGASVTATVTDGEVTSVDGNLAADLLKDGKKIASLQAKGQYDVKQRMLVKLVASASLDTEFALLNGGVKVKGASGQLTIENNRLTKMSGEATFTAPAINVENAKFAFTWRNDGEKDLYGFDGKLGWVLFKEKERWLKGDLALKYNEDGTFLGAANIDYQMAKGFAAKGKLSMDHKLEPTVDHLEFGIDTTLTDAKKLFEFETTIVQFLVQILVFRLALGIDIGSSLDMKPLALQGKFAVENWATGKDADKQTPDFSADLKMPWGLDFNVWLAAWLEASLNVLVASAGIGSKAKLVLNVPINLTPSLTLQGGKDGWSGAFGIDLEITPRLLLELSAYLFASLILFDPWYYELGKWPFNLGDLPGIKWSETFAFGDSKKAKSGAKKTKAEPQGGTPKKEQDQGVKVDKKPDQIAAPPKKDSKKANDAALPGGDAISGDALLGKQGKGADKNAEGQAASENQLGLIMEAAEGLQAVDVFIKFIKECAGYILTSGPVLGPIALAWDWLAGNIDKKKLMDAWDQFKRGIKAAGKLLKGMADNKFSFTYRLGRWLNGEITAWQLIMEGDDEIVAIVKKGEHKAKDLTAKNFNQMLLVLTGEDNYCGSDDSWAVIELLKEAGRRGFIHQAVYGLKGLYKHADQVLWKLDGKWDDQARALYKQYGVVVGKEYENMLAEKYPLDYRNLRYKLSFMDVPKADAIFESSGKTAAINWAKAKLGK